MNQQGFEDYTYFVFGRKNGTANSYIMAIRILDRIFAIKDVFELHGKTLTELDDDYFLQRIADFVSSEEKKFKNLSKNLTKLGNIELPVSKKISSWNIKINSLLIKLLILYVILLS